MTPIELALTSLSEATAITYHQNRNSQGFPELKRDAIDAGKTAGKARRVIEEDIGTPVVSQENYLNTKKVKDKRRREQKRLNESTEPSLFDELEDADD